MSIYSFLFPSRFEEASPDESETDRRLDRPKSSDKVGTAGKGNAEAGTWKAPRKSDRKDLIESETQDRREAPGGKPER
ncbi:hypothetical protein AB0G32_40240, partial [Streptomyces sp. NPDC023723]|uniref:hypothetical protein n=1 Tax=Streptomyces sp. NPDC023723 TaxID=3154323 RepID=UPI00340C7872